jgi:conjugal transfer/entry exclusion protein
VQQIDHAFATTYALTLDGNQLSALLAQQLADLTATVAAQGRA